MLLDEIRKLWRHNPVGFHFNKSDGSAVIFKVKNVGAHESAFQFRLECMHP